MQEQKASRTRDMMAYLAYLFLFFAVVVPAGVYAFYAVQFYTNYLGWLTGKIAFIFSLEFALLVVLGGESMIRDALGIDRRGKE